MTKVLFVEGRADLRTMIQDALAEVGYDVEAISAEPAGVAACASSQPDLIIYDRDGLAPDSVDAVDSLIGRLTRDGRDPVIALSDDAEDAVNAVRCALCLPAPLDIDALIVAAAGLLNGELTGSHGTLH